MTSAAFVDPITAAHTVLPVLAEHSAAGEMARSVHPAAMAAIKDAGLSRMLAPKRFGGMELPPSAHVRSCIALAHGCSAAAWVHMVCGAHTYVVGRYPEECQREVFGETPDVLVPGTLAPQGKAVKVAGGWRLSGRWQFGSGVDHGPWLLLGALVVDEAGGEPAGAIHAIVPTEEITVDDTWFTLGMRGSGSKDLVADEVFVPEHRTMPTRELFRGDFEGGPEIGPLYRLPVMGGLATMLAGAVLGMTQHGLEQFIGAVGSRREAYSGNSKAGKPGVQMRLAEALAEANHAGMLIEQNCAMLDIALAENCPPLETERAAAIRWNAAYAVELCRRATERVYAIAGANATRDSDPLQRWYRDINTASHHAICDFDAALEMKGRLTLGLSAGAVV